MEFRCYPSNRGIGMNRFDVSMAIAAFNQPNFRAYSAGGINTAGLRTLVLPDSADTPSGGFNPLSTPPGKATLTDSDNLSYLGQLDTVVRVSVVHTVWLDAGLGILPIWQAQVTLPTRDDQPLGTEVLLEFRGATGFAGTSGAEFDATKLNAYGELTMGTANFLGSGSWSSDISTANGGEFIQVRITFKNNIETGLSPKLDALALPFNGS